MDPRYPKKRSVNMLLDVFLFALKIGVLLYMSVLFLLAIYMFYCADLAFEILFLNKFWSPFWNAAWEVLPILWYLPSMVVLVTMLCVMFQIRIRDGKIERLFLMYWVVSSRDLEDVQMLVWKGGRWLSCIYYVDGTVSGSGFLVHGVAEVLDKIVRPPSGAPILSSTETLKNKGERGGIS